MIDCDIVIIDSGLDSKIAPNVPGICIENSEEGYAYTEDLSDNIGHGTIIYSVIKKQTLSNNIFIIKVDEDINRFDFSL